MANIARAALKSILFASGAYKRILSRVAFPGVAVLCYHGLRDDSQPLGVMNFEQLHVRAGELEAHCRFAREFCNPISLNDWRAASSGGPALPKRPVLFTFDDGYRTIFTLALPILKKYAIPAAIFISDAPMRNRSLYWFDAAARKYGEEKVEGFKKLSFLEWQDLYDKTRTLVNDDDPHALLKEDEVIAISNLPGFEIGSHTTKHGILSSMQPEEQREEILQNKDYLERVISKKIKAFAYPNGEPGKDYTSATVEILRDKGFDMAFTTRYDYARVSDYFLELPRFPMLSGISAYELAWRLLRCSLKRKKAGVPA